MNTSARPLPARRTRALAAIAALAASALAAPAFAQGRSATPKQPAPAGFASLRLGGALASGLDIDRSRYGIGCGPLADCHRFGAPVHLYSRSMLSERWGAEIGLVDTGRMQVGAGSVRAQGVSFSVLRQVSVSETFSAYGKLGTTFGQSATTAAAGSGLRQGSANGFGLSYGAGLSWNFAPGFAAVLAWDSHDFPQAAGGRDPVRATSVGFRYHY